jgi:hypothetical protein
MAQALLYAPRCPTRPELDGAQSFCYLHYTVAAQAVWVCFDYVSLALPGVPSN